MTSEQLSKALSKAYKAACMGELEALKPGNVHVFSDGHGMDIHDFIKSADASAAVIAQPDFTVGERILHSVQATQEAVGLNTNLGIILLCAPLIQAEFNLYSAQNSALTLHQSLCLTLSQLSLEDADLTAQAIVLANPAGLGHVEENDVHAKPSVNLFEMMSSAQEKDRIAWQYANQFLDIFDFGLATYTWALEKWANDSNARGQNRAWATTALYLGFLARQLDSHVVRKHGVIVAKQFMQEATEIYALFLAAENPKLVQKQLLIWDASLKSRHINPGTSADLTVACLMLNYFEEFV